MAKKKEQEVIGFDIQCKEKELLTKFDFFLKMVNLFFNEGGLYFPEKVNDLTKEWGSSKKENPFYKKAREMADELGIKWEEMSNEESNRIIINMLSDAYMDMCPGNKRIIHTTYTITLDVAAKEPSKKEKEEK